MIDEYASGRIVVDGSEYISDVIIYPDHIEDDWWRRAGHRLQQADLDSVLAASPEILIVGTGTYGRMQVDPQVERELAKRDIELIALPTEQACQRYLPLPLWVRAWSGMPLPPLRGGYPRRQFPPFCCWSASLCSWA